MKLIWNPFMNDVTQDYSWWDKSQNYEMSHDDPLHPFDFLYAFTDQGMDKLDFTFPVDRSAKVSYGNDKDDVQGWGYQGCEGERHNDVKNKKASQNDACNLYDHIKNSCGCTVIDGQKLDDLWRDFNVNVTCWSQCMSDYIA